MANNIIPFDFNGHEIRTLGTWESPLFVAADVCEVLELTNVSKACEALDDDEKGITTSDTLGGEQEMLCLTESGLYSLVIRSRKKQAKTFKKWITSEVIPSIRKTGSYAIEQQQLSPAEALLKSVQLLVDIERRQLEAEAREKLREERIETIEMETMANATELERFRNGHGYYFSIAGWCSKQGYRKSLEELNLLGRKATAMCKQKGIRPERVTDPRWGTVNTYPDTILMEMVF